MTDYPECEKLLKIAPERNVQEAFLEWLAEQGYHLAQERCPHGRLQDDMVNCTESEYCRSGQQDTSLWPSIELFENLLMKYHGIDMKKVETERRAMLADQRDANYCPACQHPWPYHGKDGCSMPVTPGTHLPITRGSDARERCNCTETR